jgi:hypothetical protein
MATLVAPLLPGVESGGLIDYRGGGTDGAPGVVLNPLVSVANRLNELADVEMFTVESDRRSYWRETSLDAFDGTDWKRSFTVEAVTGDLPRSVEPDGEVETAIQRFTIERLGGVLMPAAYRPVAIRDERHPIRWDDESATLAIGRGFENSDGDTYTVESRLPSLDPDILRAASPVVPDDVAEVYLDLPDGFPDRIVAEAKRVVTGQETAYDRAKALQDYFHGDRFAYDKTVEPESSNHAMEAFLFQTRRGFCQQFAATYAAMARAVGLPTRVATGFTTGDQDPTQPGLYHVRGSDGHAWPEVYLGEYGWVLFEPTKGRAIPDDRAAGADASPATTAVPRGVDDPFEGEVPDAAVPDDPDTQAGGSIEESGGVWSTGLRWTVRVLGLGLLGLAALATSLAALAAGRVLSRLGRRRRAIAPNDRVRVAWTESIEAAEMLGVIWRPWETPTEFARRAWTADDSGSFTQLAETLVAADYSAEGVTDDDARRARRLASRIGHHAKQRATRQQRLRALVDPRSPQRWIAARTTSEPANDTAPDSAPPRQAPSRRSA